MEQPSNFDEKSMQCFADSLKDLKNLRAQLYSAAEYFEQSYTNNKQNQVVIETIKDYAIKAVVNTVDHLGSMTYQVNNLLNENVEQVSRTEFRVSWIEQRLRTCREYIDREGLAQQSSIINTPRFHKRYILPGEKTIKDANLAKLKFNEFNLDDVDDFHQRRNAFRGTSRSSSFRKGRSISPSLRPSRLPGTFSFNVTTRKKDPDRRSVSPHRFPLLRSGSLVTRPTPAPKPSRPTTPNPAVERQLQNLSKPSRSASMRVHDDREDFKEIQRQPSKSKRLLKSLLTRRKSKKDDTLYTYLDEY